MSEPSARFPRRLGRTLGALLLALLNATLILLAVCLWFGWKMVFEARAITGEVAASVALLQPLQSEILGLRADVSGLRSDLAALQGQANPAPAVAALSARLAGIDSRIAATTERADALLADPGSLVDRAVDRAAMQIKSGIAACTPLGS